MILRLTLVSVISGLIGFAAGAFIVVQSAHDTAFAVNRAGKIGMWEKLYDRESRRLSLIEEGNIDQVTMNIRKARVVYATALKRECLDRLDCYRIDEQKSREIREVAEVR